MKRFINVLAVTALMVVLMTTTISPAFAQGRGYKCGDQDTAPGNKEEECPEYTAKNNELWGYGCGQKKFNTVYRC
jgi:hypothetical protein